MEKSRTGLYVEKEHDELRLIVVFDQGAAQGEVVVPLSLGCAARLAQLIIDFQESKRVKRGALVVKKTLEFKAGKHNA